MLKPQVANWMKSFLPPLGLREAERMAERTMDVIAYWLSLGQDYIPGVEDQSVSDAINGGFLRVFLLHIGLSRKNSTQ